MQIGNTLRKGINGLPGSAPDVYSFQPILGNSTLIMGLADLQVPRIGLPSGGSVGHKCRSLPRTYPQRTPRHRLSDCRTVRTLLACRYLARKPPPPRYSHENGIMFISELLTRTPEQWVAPPRQGYLRHLGVPRLSGPRAHHASSDASVTCKKPAYSDCRGTQPPQDANRHRSPAWREVSKQVRRTS